MDIKSKLKMYKDSFEKTSEKRDESGLTSSTRIGDNTDAPGMTGTPDNSDMAGMTNVSHDKACPGKAPGAGLDVMDLVPGSVCSNDYGSFYIMESRYELSHAYGGCRLGDALKVGPDCISALCSDPPHEMTLEKMLFLDTETTGLSGGAGTVAFLAGVGWFEGRSFVIRQYFMRDYDEETAMLRELDALMAGFEGLVTFNGRSFDWNLLQGRFVSNRIRPSLRSPVHLDLLYPSRRIWGLSLESCRLSSLEENILGERREDDIPGALIPSVYFRYLEKKDASDITRVIKHNELDILTMVPLLSRISSLLESPLSNASGGLELLGVGRMLEAKGDYRLMEECLEVCAGSGDYTVMAAAVRRLSGVYKRSGRYSRAMEHWRRMAEGSGGFDLFPMVEMAMYYEHREKDVTKALDIVEAAMQACLKSGLNGGRQFAELRRRLDRLRRKASSMDSAMKRRDENG